MPRSAQALARERARRARRRDLEALLTDAVREDGFVKKNAVYTAPLAPDVEAWLAFQVVRDGDTFSVFPNVGVRHEELHALIDRLHGRKPQPTPTLTCLLGYLMPEKTGNVAWEFCATDDPHWKERAVNILAHIDRYARPWIEQYQTLDAILDGLDRYGMPPYNPQRRAAALVLLGRREEAATEADRELTALGGRSDPAAGHYRRFALALKREFRLE